METLEFMFKLSRDIQLKLDEVDALIERARDLPVRSGTGNIYKELLASGYLPDGEGDYGTGTAWGACTRIIEQRNAMHRLAGELRCETEVLTAIADDLIGKTGRLV